MSPNYRMRPGLTIGLAALIACMTFFTYDVAKDILQHIQNTRPYGLGELIHVVFEAFAVSILAFSGFTIRTYIKVLSAQGIKDEKTISLLRGDFDRIIHGKFADWQLTPAEKDVALLTIRGMNIAEIAQTRSTASGTTKAQLTAIFRKIGVKSKAELMSVLIEEFLDQSANTPAPASAPQTE